MSIWMIVAGVAFLALLIWLGSNAQEAGTEGEKRAWNFALGAILIGGTAALALI